jgi:hypothetical protein
MKKSEFEMWVNREDTREILDILNREIKGIEQALLEGMYAREATMELVAGKYIDAQARLSGLKFIFNEIVNYLEEDIKENE